MRRLRERHHVMESLGLTGRAEAVGYLGGCLTPLRNSETKK